MNDDMIIASEESLLVIFSGIFINGNTAYLRNVPNSLISFRFTQIYWMYSPIK